MLGGSFLRDFDEDPFFAGQQQQMQRMQQMMMMPMNPMLMGSTIPRDPNQRPASSMGMGMGMGMGMVPFGMFGNSLGFAPMFSNMRQMMGDMERNIHQVQMTPSHTMPTGHPGHTFTQSSFVSYSNTGQGQPQVYQATSSTTQAPGGVKETRRTVRDTSTGVEKMAVGHHINDRAHVIERSRNRNTGEQNENQEYINLDEEEAPTFDREWQEKTRHLARGMDIHRSRHNPIGNGRRGRQLAALPDSRSRKHRDRE